MISAVYAGMGRRAVLDLAACPYQGLCVTLHGWTGQGIKCLNLFFTFKFIVKYLAHSSSTDTLLFNPLLPKSDL